MPRLLTAEELDRQLTDLPGVEKGTAGTLVLSVRARSFPDAVRMIDRVAEDAEQMNHHPDIDLRWRTLVFTLSTHSAGGVTQLDVELAHRILEVASDLGAQSMPAPDRLEICLDAADPDAVRPFWQAGLGYRQALSSSGEIELHAADGRLPVLWFQRMQPPRTQRGRFHLDIYLPDVAEAQRRLEACLAAGGRLVTDAHAPSWWVVADHEGNELRLCTAEADPSA